MSSEALLLRGLFSVLSPAGGRGRLSILIFHRVLPVADPLFPDQIDAQRFDALCGWIAGWFNVLPLDVAAAQLAAGRLPPRALSITFDDGYADNREVALPILQRHGLTATFFVATGFLDGGRMWNDTVIEAIRRTQQPALDLGRLPGGLQAVLTLDGPAARRSAIDRVLAHAKYLPSEARVAFVDALAENVGVVPPHDLMMRSEQVRELHRAGMQIGAHTVTHPILARLDPATASREIRRSKQCLEGLLGARVGLFAYPNGKPGEDYAPEHADIVRGLGFDAAVSTAWGASDRGSDPLQLPRFTPWDRSRLRFAARMMGNLRRAPVAA